MISIIIASLCFSAISAKNVKVSDNAGQVAITASFYNNFFSGALINSQWVLTVALPLFNTERFIVYLGLNNGKFDQVVSGNEYIIHPHFSYTNQNNNIALLKLQQSVIENRFVKSLRIASKMNKIMSSDLFDYQSYTLTGWDITSENPATSPPRKFRTQLVYTISYKTCQKQKKKLVIDPKVFCTIPHQGNPNFCADQPGSPLTYLHDNGEPVLFGISSVTSVCHSSYFGDRINVALNLSQYKRWILQNTHLIDIFI